jgi:hypothetical protein
VGRTPWGLAVGIPLLITGCGGADEVQPAVTGPPHETPAQSSGEFVIVAGEPREFAFDFPGSVPAGEYEFTLTNEGKQFHQAQILRLEDGMSFEQFEDALLSGAAPGTDFPEAAREMVVGSPTGVQATTSADEVGTRRGELEPGVHAVVCFLPDVRKTGRPHYTFGMLAELTVT